MATKKKDLRLTSVNYKVRWREKLQQKRILMGCTTETDARTDFSIYGGLILRDCENLFPDYLDNHIDYETDYS
jgi:hypothetical protein